MKQILQNLRSGEMQLTDIPDPVVQTGHCLIQTRASLISAGTERMLVEFSQANLIAKARQQPDKVKQVLDKIKTDGLQPTLEAVFRKLDQPLPLGYCNAGVVLEVGKGVHDIKPGDRVASNGPHAEIVHVPRHLCAIIPETVSDEQAAFTVLSSIALQGIRLTNPTLGETVMVFGQGLIGLLTTQLLRANGCRVLAVDINEERLKMARQFGAETICVGANTNPADIAQSLTGGKGVDAVIITASSKSDDIIHQAADACRKRGRIILVGVIGLNLRRSDFYKKEISFQVSCSYGPGRYDESYEQRGIDYPEGYVRWTENRNFEAILELMQSGSLNLNDLITNRYELDDAAKAYETIQKTPSSLGVILQYPQEHILQRSVRVSDKPHDHPTSPATPQVGFIGAGNFAKAELLPGLKAAGTTINAIASRSGITAQHLAAKFNIQDAVSDYTLILNNTAINTIFIALPHHLHARVTCEALTAGKHVFVEKPLAITEEELSTITDAHEAHSDLHLMVGYNRRFSPHTLKVKELLAQRATPLCMTMTVNAGYIPSDHWLQDPDRGGGRIIGEACHFIDLLSFISGSLVTSVTARMLNGHVQTPDDKMTILLTFSDGSIGTVHYFANGSKSYPKEKLTVFNEGKVVEIDNFRVTRGYGFTGFKSFKTKSQDKGHANEIKAFIKGIADGKAPLISYDELCNSTRASFAAVESSSNGSTIVL